eukprot:scaffold65196_cov16-Tisochrysis_lutea.AAC.1
MVLHCYPGKYGAVHGCGMFWSGLVANTSSKTYLQSPKPTCGGKTSARVVSIHQPIFAPPLLVKCY